MLSALVEKVLDREALGFAKCFYRDLLDGYTVQVAFDNAVKNRLASSGKTSDFLLLPEKVGAHNSADSVSVHELRVNKFQVEYVLDGD